MSQWINEAALFLSTIDWGKTLALFLPSGAIGICIDKWRRRIQVVIRDLQHPPGDTSFRYLVFMAENTSEKITSLEPKVAMRALSPERTELLYRFTINEADRKLEPHVERKFILVHGERVDTRIMLFAWFPVIVLPLTKGRSLTLRYRNVAEFKRLSFLRFHFERIWFLVKGYPRYG